MVNYNWKVGNNWNYINCIAEKNPESIINKKSTGVYEVVHPKWRIHKVKSYDIVCDAKQLYGEAFTEILNQKPASVFLAEGSPVQVMKGKKLTSNNL